MRKNFACGHKGLGKWCHRCAAAEKLEKNPPKGKTPSEVKEEATRLRSVPRNSTPSLTAAPVIS
jgi:hypothetical protein